MNYQLISIKKMITKKSKFFKKLYIIDLDDRDISDRQMNSLIMCGDNNWDYYFEYLYDQYLPDVTSEVESVFLHEFYNKDDFNSFFQSINKRAILDISMEKDFYAVLQLVQI